jgi:hypothetical protein
MPKSYVNKNGQACYDYSVSYHELPVTAKIENKATKATKQELVSKEADNVSAHVANAALLEVLNYRYNKKT